MNKICGTCKWYPLNGLCGQAAIRKDPNWKTIIHKPEDKCIYPDGWALRQIVPIESAEADHMPED